MTHYIRELRERIVADLESGRSYRAVQRDYGVHPTTARGFLRQKQTTGSVEPGLRRGGQRKLLGPEALDVLRTLREEDPGARLEDLAERLFARTGIQVSKATVGKELQALGFRRKRKGKPRAERRRRTTAPARPSGPVVTRYQRTVPEPPEPAPGGRKPYPSDLTDAEWRLLEPLIPSAKPGGRAEQHPKREIVNAILYVLRSGCQWRMLPHDFPPHTTVYDYFRAWRDEGVWQRANQVLREQARMRAGRNLLPSAGIVDSQSAKTTEKGGPEDMTGRSA